MARSRKLIVPSLVGLAAIAGIVFWYFVALSAVAAESGQEMVTAAYSAKGLIYGLRAIALAVLVALVLRFVVLARE